MNFTFGIITDGNADDRVNLIIDSIEKQNIKNYEVIVVGPNYYNRKNTTSILFKEDPRGHITYKKNLITYNAKYDNVVYMHDYYALEPEWYLGQISKGDDFYIRMDKIVNYDGSRFRDWCIWPHNGNEMDQVKHNCLLPYSITGLSKYMYISGGYWIAKLNVMKEFPLDERLFWGEGEDVIWSKIVRKKYNFDMNENSTVRIIKSGKDRVFKEMEGELLEKIKLLNDKINNI
jgi:hypothetical protein